MSGYNGHDNSSSSSGYNGHDSSSNSNGYNGHDSSSSSSAQSGKLLCPGRMSIGRVYTYHSYY